MLYIIALFALEDLEADSYISNPYIFSRIITLHCIILRLVKASHNRDTPRSHHQQTRQTRETTRLKTVHNCLLFLASERGKLAWMCFCSAAMTDWMTDCFSVFNGSLDVAIKAVHLFRTRWRYTLKRLRCLLSALWYLIIWISSIFCCAAQQMVCPLFPIVLVLYLCLYCLLQPHQHTHF